MRKRRSSDLISAASWCWRRSAEFRIPSWFIVAKVDLDEIHAPIREHAYLATVLVVVLMFAAWANVASIWRRQRAEFYRKQFEVEVERHALEKHHAFLTKYANDIILLMDENLMIQDANDRALVGLRIYPEGTLCAQWRKHFMHRRHGKAIAKQIETLRREGAAVVETIHQRKDGTRFPVESSSRVIRVDETVFYQSIMRDISQRKVAEQAMLESEARFRAVFEKAGIGIALTEPGGRFLETNHALHEMFGYSAEELKQFSFDMLLHPDDRQQNSRYLQIQAARNTLTIMPGPSGGTPQGRPCRVGALDEHHRVQRGRKAAVST